MTRLAALIAALLLAPPLNRDPIVQDPGEQEPPGVCTDCVIVKWITES